MILAAHKNTPLHTAYARGVFKYTGFDISATPDSTAKVCFADLITCCQFFAGTAKGNITVNSVNLSITIDDANNDHVAELKVEGYITVTFTPNEGADEVVDQNGIRMKYQLSNTGLIYDEDAIFAYSSAEVVMNNGNAAKSVTIQASELGITLKNSIELHTVAEYEAFKAALHTGSLCITVSEATA